MTLTAEQREALRQQVSEARRATAPLSESECPMGQGSEAGYSFGCRCRPCTSAATAKRRERRQLASGKPVWPYQPDEEPWRGPAVVGVREDNRCNPQRGEKTGIILFCPHGCMVNCRAEVGLLDEDVA